MVIAYIIPDWKYEKLELLYINLYNVISMSYE